jgi:RNA polymerase sigma-70 factor, ECF subfamily
MSQYASSIARQESASIWSDTDQESSWISASQYGDTRAFNHLVLKWEKRVYGVAFRMLRNREEAAEATQDVFLLAYRSIRRFRKDAKFSTWIYRIVVNHCLTRMKQRPHGTHFSLESEGFPEGPASQLRVAETQTGALMREEQRNRVLAALWRLPPDQQAVIELKFFQDLTFEEIAATLEVPLSTIKSRLYSGLEMLKTRLGTEA